MPQDFSNGFHVTELEGELVEIAEEINDYMRDISNNRKKGKANTARLALKLAIKEINRRQENKQKVSDEIERIHKTELEEISSL